MRPYPLFLDLSGRRALILGAGSVGRRKLFGLLPCGLAHILILDPCASRKEQLPSDPCVRFENRSWHPYDLDGMALVFAASGDRAVNAALATLARERGIWCNVADAPAEGDFSVPALMAADGLLAAFSTNGDSPALARRIARETSRRFGPLLAVLTRLRPLVLGLGLESAENAAIFRAVAESQLADTLGQPGMDEQNVLLLQSLLPQALHGEMSAIIGTAL